MQAMKEKPLLMLAPMVDLSHVAYRELIRELGGCDLFYSEMLNARRLPLETPQNSVYLKWSCKDDLILQLIGNEPEKLARAAGQLDAYAPAGIDLNLGCWLKKITCHGWGVALMRELETSRQIITAMRPQINRPFSVKIRIGHEPDAAYLKDFILMLCGCGVDRVVLHARTVADGLNRPPRWEYLALAKAVCTVPLIGNGGIECAADAVRMLAETGCDGVMVGRAALVKPWIFRDIRNQLAGREPEPAPELRGVILELLERLEDHFDAVTAMKRLRTALPFLARNLNFGHHLVKEVGHAASPAEGRAIIEGCYAEGLT